MLHGQAYPLEKKTDMKKRFYLLLTIAAILALVTGCSFGGGSGNADRKIGVAMPAKELQRWNQDGANMKKELAPILYKFFLFSFKNKL